MSERGAPEIASFVAAEWGITSDRPLHGRLNHVWQVEAQKTRGVLRASSLDPWDDVEYELDLLRRLHRAGWPVPEPLAVPINCEGRIWCLYSWLPGEPPAGEDTAEDRRARGRLLAELHETTSTFSDLGQRSGFARADDVVNDPELEAATAAYEGVRPAEGHLLRWHLAGAQEAFARVDRETAETLVLHSDLTPWNLLFDAGKLSGILDFEATHHNFRVADFALSWRGELDEVIEGYQEVHRFTELDWALLLPTYWSWMFLGVKKAVTGMQAGGAAPNFDWEIDHLLRRSSLVSNLAPAYPPQS